ncbi:MAG: DUF1788 domain-containing protein [Tissierellaceae bacterium]|nr:DUF1788 domain-containing protein [Tissierellaceae bacterium]
MTNLKERLDLLIPKIKEEKFLEGRGLGNEISFYVFDYDPKEELLVRDHIKHIIREFEKPTSNIKIIEFDLYNMIFDLAKEMNILETLFEMEKMEGKDALYDGMELLCEPTVFMDKIHEESKNFDVIFISGVGKAFPFLRSHSILNNLMEIIHDKPLIMFYPGQYDEMYLKLFGIMEKGYYRAFRLIDIK